MSIREVAELFGPAWIALMADADAASIIGAMSTGEQYGYRLLWFVALLAVPIFLVQEAAGRLGAVTGKGVGELVRERYSGKVALLSAVPIFAVDVFTYLSEYTGIALGSALLGISPLFGLLLFFTLHLFVVVTRSHKRTESVLILVSLLLFGSSLAAVSSRVLHPSPLLYFSTSKEFLFFLAVNVGAVVTPPCTLIYQASSTAKKYPLVSANVKDKVKWASRETLLGAAVTELIVALMEMVGANLGASVNLFHLSYNFLDLVLGSLLISSGFLALVVVSLSSAWGVLEATGRNSDTNTLKLYALESIPALMVVSLMLRSLQAVFNLALTLLTLSPLAFSIMALLVGMLVSDEELMGKFVYGRGRKFIYLLTVALILLGGVVGLLPNL